MHFNILWSLVCNHLFRTLNLNNYSNQSLWIRLSFNKLITCIWTLQQFYYIYILDKQLWEDTDLPLKAAWCNRGDIWDKYKEQSLHFRYIVIIYMLRCLKIADLCNESEFSSQRGSPDKCTYVLKEMWEMQI